MRNKIKELVENRGITPYRFWKDTGLSQPTAYRLCRDMQAVPTGEVLEAICKAYNVQPGDLLEYIPDGEVAHASP